MNQLIKLTDIGYFNSYSCRDGYYILDNPPRVRSL
jgi:hypothetical protein